MNERVPWWDSFRRGSWWAPSSYDKKQVNDSWVVALSRMKVPLLGWLCLQICHWFLTPIGTRIPVYTLQECSVVHSPKYSAPTCRKWLLAVLLVCLLDFSLCHSAIRQCFGLRTRRTVPPYTGLLSSILFGSLLFVKRGVPAPWSFTTSTLEPLIPSPVKPFVLRPPSQ